jgi:tetratricopeptide (TPR) repeat protein
MMKKFPILLLLLLLFATPVVALADIAPPAKPPGANLQPGDEATQVRMLAETVLMEVKAGSGDSLGQANVSADFTMRNQGEQAETLRVRFPISANDGFSRYPELKNLQVLVNGRPISTRRILGEDPYYGGDEVPWAEFQASFPPGVDVPVRVTYTLDGSGYPPFAAFNYILATGAGWKDTIGSADVVVRLPYEANTQNVLLAGETGYPFTSPGATFDGKEIRWHFDDLEPTYADNLEVELVMPAHWQKVLAEQANIQRNPDDGEAWGRLGKLYKEIAFLPKELRPDPGGQALIDLSAAAYEKCLALRPNDAEWHAGFAELYVWRYNVTSWMDPANDADLKRALDLLYRAIEINPKTPKVVEMLDELADFYPQYLGKTVAGYDFLYLTATPEILPSQTAEPPTLEPSATLPGETPTPTIMRPTSTLPAPTATATLLINPAYLPAAAAVDLNATQTPPESNSGVSVCGVGLLPLLGAVVVGWRRRRGRVRKINKVGVESNLTA